MYIVYKMIVRTLLYISFINRISNANFFQTIFKDTEMNPTNRTNRTSGTRQTRSFPRSRSAGAAGELRQGEGPLAMRRRLRRRSRSSFRFPRQPARGVEEIRDKTRFSDVKALAFC